MLGGNVEELYVFGLNKDRGHMNDEWGGVWWCGGGGIYEYMVGTPTVGTWSSLEKAQFSQSYQASTTGDSKGDRNYTNSG